MKYKITVIIISFYQLLTAQNLVPNGSFELNGSIDCGIYAQTNFINSAYPWFIPSGTPDLYSNQINQSCYNFMPNSTYSGPVGLKGTQAPIFGRVFAGISCYTIDGLNGREFMSVQLTSPLTPGFDYCVEFYVSAADYQEKFINNLGAYLSTNPSNGLGDIPQLNTSSIISDTSGWVLVSGNVHATEAYHYITIGNFYDDASTLTQLNSNNAGQPGTYGAYYYIDAVSVNACTATASINNSSQTYLSFYPNPAIDEIMITNPAAQPTQITITNLAGETLVQTNSTQSLFKVDISPLSSGVYFIRMKSGSTQKIEKLIKN
jgi:hypothetical protein